jgi:hypothetical protein
MFNQNFDSVHQSSSSIEIKVAEVERIVRSKNFDQQKIFQAIANYLGPDNIDESMLNFAVQQSIKKVKELFDQEKINQVKLDNAIKLVVDWSFIKIKAKQKPESKEKSGDVQIGSNKPKGSSINSLF